MMTGKIGEVLEGIRQAEKRQDDDHQAQRDDGRSLAEKIAAGRAGLRSMYSKAKEEDAERKKREEARKLGEEEAKRKADREQKQKQPEQKSGFKHPKPRGG